MNFFTKEGNIFVQKGFKIPQKSFTTDMSGKNTFNPSKMRWYNTFEISQFIRFMIAIHWTKKHFDKLLKSNKKRRYVADFGCSWSQFYSYWRSNCNYFGWPQIAYHGVDANIDRLVFGKTTITPKRNDRFKHYLADLTVPFKLKKRMDVIVCLETIEHVPKKKVIEVLKNIKRNLKRDGVAILSSPNPRKDKGEEWAWGESSHGDHSYEWSFGEITKLLQDNVGLKIIDCCGCLPRREFKNRTSWKSPRDALASRLPPSLVNSILCTIDNMDLCIQWMTIVRKRGIDE